MPDDGETDSCSLSEVAKQRLDFSDERGHAAPRKETPNYPPQRQTLESHVRRQFPETETKSL